MHRFTPDQNQFLRDNVYGKCSAELTELFNAAFDTELSVNQIKAAKKNRGLTSGLTGHFPKGGVSWNKGRFGHRFAPEHTLFRKGQMPHNYLPVGSEIVNTDGYLVVKTADPKTWKAKHRLIWEDVNGPVPKGHVLVFGDGDKMNVSLDNLVLLTKAQMVRMAQLRLFGGNADQLKTGAIIADIRNKIGKRRKEVVI